MKIEINLKIIFVLIIFALFNKFDVYLIFIIFIFAHELAHMICGMILGFKPKILKLNPLGVSIDFYNYSENNKENRYKRIITYVSGPITNFIFSIVFCLIPISPIIKTKIIYTNTLIGIFNLIPILPLDGGKILKEILKLFYNNKSASIFMLYSSKMLLVLLTITYSIAIFKVKNIAIFLLILYLWYLYILEEKKELLFIKVYETIEKN